MRKLFLLSICVLFFWGNSLKTQAPSPQSLIKHSVDKGLRYIFTKGLKQIEKSRTPVLLASKYIVSAVKCHREYSLEDGPVVRSFLEIILKNRKQEGGFFGEDCDDPFLSTIWAIEALKYLDEEAYKNEIKIAEIFLQRKYGKKASTSKEPFSNLVDSFAKDISALPENKRNNYILNIVFPLVKTQEKNGSWNKEGKPVEETLNNLVKLVALEQITLGKKKIEVKGIPEFVVKGVNYLVKKAKDGKWFLAGAPDPGITAMCLTAVLMLPESQRTKEIKDTINKAINFLLSCQDKDGAFSSSGVPVYVTSATIQAFLASGRPDLKPAIRKGMNFLLMMQNIERRGYTPGDRDYGSIGYGGDMRGDLSNLQMAIDSLRSAGLSSDNEALVKALTFLQRTQNLSSVNHYKTKRKIGGKLYTVVPGNDGGAAYYPGYSNAGFIKLSDGTLIPRSYGSMTWALLKSYILCGLDKNDERVKAAWKWLQEHYTLDENPGFPKDQRKLNKQYQGLFYYYLTMARTLTIMGIDKIRVPKKEGDKITWTVHNWREEILAKLKSLQREDGSWINEKSPRWFEGNPDLATAYAVLVCAHALKLPNVPLPK